MPPTALLKAAKMSPLLHFKRAQKIDIEAKNAQQILAAVFTVQSAGVQYMPPAVLHCHILFREDKQKLFSSFLQRRAFSSTVDLPPPRGIEKQNCAPFAIEGSHHMAPPRDSAIFLEIQSPSPTAGALEEVSGWVKSDFRFAIETPGPSSLTEKMRNSCCWIADNTIRPFLGENYKGENIYY